MKIARLTVRAADLPLRERYRLSGGRLAFERLDRIFMRVDTDEGPSDGPQSRLVGSPSKTNSL